MANVELLELSALKEGELVRAVSGEEPEAYKYDFLVVKEGRTPECLLTETRPNGEVTRAATVILEGTGQWLTPKENPCQSYSPKDQITIAFGMMSIGGSIIIGDPKRLGRRTEFIQPLTAIEVYAAN